MKNLLLIFLLANILYFLYAAFSGDEPEPGVAIVHEDELGPQIDVSIGEDDVASVGAVLGSGEPEALDAVAGRSCVTVGPFRAMDEADAAMNDYREAGRQVQRRSADADVFIGHWVQIRNVASASEASGFLATLREGGLGDSYFVETENLISLGLFGDESGARKIEKQALDLDLPAEILPRTSNERVYFVDIGFPPGQDITAIVEKFGETQVLQRQQATCPE